MDILKNLFASFDQQESLIFMAFALIAFLIGFVLSWLVYRRQVRKWRQEAQKNTAELQSLQAEYQSFKDQFTLREADLQLAHVELEESKRRMQSLQDERNRLAGELEESHAELVRMESSISAQQVTIEDLNDQIQALRTKDQQSTQEESETVVSPPPPVMETPREEPALEPIDAVAEMQSAFNAALQRLSAIEEKLQRMESENERLRSQATQIQPEERSMAAVEQLFEMEEEDEDAVVEGAREYIRQALGSVLPVAVESQKDDLQKIQGIGPFLEKQLNELGLYTYEQISKLNETQIEQLTTAIRFFPGRILKDDWVGQATRLYGQNPVEAKGTPAPSNPDEGGLQIVEGIGPKIESLLADAGIHTLRDLAGTEVERLQDILQAAGDRYRLHDPSTWPEQARLAAEGEWDQLKTFKEYLNAGKHKE